MAAFSYSSQALPSEQTDSGSQKKGFSLPAIDTCDCLDFMTSFCILLPFESVLNEDVELPMSQASSTQDKNYLVRYRVHDDFDDGSNRLLEQKQHLTSKSVGREV